MPPSLRLDANDDVITQPVTGWGIAASQANRVVLLALEYLDNPAQLQTGERGQLQATLSPEQALEIAATLASAAGKLLRLGDRAAIDRAIVRFITMTNVAACCRLQLLTTGKADLAYASGHLSMSTACPPRPPDDLPGSGWPQSGTSPNEHG
jgi:hypothetical protein